MAELRVHEKIAEIPAADWDGLHDGGNPFLGHAFLHGLEACGCLRPRWGWTPLHATLHERGRLLAAAPAYVKHNSHGEYVFDHAWAHAWARHGLDYYPKWLVAVPYTPVPGPRLLAVDAPARRQLAEAMVAEASRRGFSSLHVNFLAESETGDCPPDWLARRDIQFHWHNPGPNGTVPWRHFDDFLAALNHRKRKNIRAERARVAASGVEFVWRHGADIDAEELAEMHALYCAGFTEKGNSPALTLAFFEHLAVALPQALAVCLARLGGQIVAGALFLRGRDRLYGRYWGSRVSLPGLHFETCYYQGIEYCLREGLRHFEPGAQGEHKLARGFLPVTTHSRHWLADSRFRSAIAGWCVHEMEATEQYRQAVLRHAPFRNDLPNSQP